MLTHGELFAGISGFGLGFGRAGIKTIWHVEIDGDCQKILRRHHPDSLILSDIRECGMHNLPRVDVISFGSPCQDMSVAGKREGLSGERSGLFFEAVRIVRELRPTFAVWENVPGALSSNGGRDFGAALDALAESGAMDIAWRILDAQWFGVAQRRRRVFVVADFTGERAAEILSVPEGVRGDSETGREKREGIAYALAASVRGSGDGHGQGWNSNYVTPSVADTIRGGQAGGASHGKPSGTDKMTMVVSAPLKASDPGRRNGGSSPIADEFVVYNQRGGYGVSEMGDISPTLQAEGGTHQGGPGRLPLIAYGGNNAGGPIDIATAQNAHGGTGRLDFESETFVVSEPAEGSQPPVVAFAWQQGTSAQGGREYIVRKGEYAGALSGSRQDAVLAFTERGRKDGRNFEAQEDLSYALTNPGGGGRTQSRQIAGGFGVRRLTPTEAERLQGFPDDFTGGQSDSVRYRQLGNAVAVPVAEWIARRIIEAER